MDKTSVRSNLLGKSVVKLIQDKSMPPASDSDMDRDVRRRLLHQYGLKL